ncbi:MAG: hypothetical protein VYD03_01890, partial [Pseudomonadota bacterium]|nr:hypothetical protein [Pseudomonadota bacterium]
MFPAIRTLFNLLLAFRTNTPGHFIVVRQWASKRKPLNPFAERSEKPEAPTMITTDTGGARSKLIGLMQIGGIVLVIALAVMVSRAPTTPTADTAPFTRPVAATGPTQVRVIQPSAMPFQISIAANGSISVRNYVNLSSQVSGRVERIS